MNFPDREKAYEDKFVHDEELHFKVRARRNKLAGQWAAPLLGANVDEYSNDLVKAMLKREQLLAKLVTDFGRAKVEISSDEIKRKIVDLIELSRKEIVG